MHRSVWRYNLQRARYNERQLNSSRTRTWFVKAAQERQSPHNSIITLHEGKRSALNFSFHLARIALVKALRSETRSRTWRMGNSDVAAGRKALRAFIDRHRARCTKKQESFEIHADLVLPFRLCIYWSLLECCNISVSYCVLIQQLHLSLISNNIFSLVLLCRKKEKQDKRKRVIYKNNLKKNWKC